MWHLFILVTTYVKNGFYSQYVIVFLEAYLILVLIKEWYWNNVYFQYSAEFGFTKLETWDFTSVAVFTINWKQPQQFLSVTPS
jgi:hypothetical protein